MSYGWFVTELCEPDGVVRAGSPAFTGADAPCSGSAHRNGSLLICAQGVHTPWDASWRMAWELGYRAAVGSVKAIDLTPFPQGRGPEFDAGAQWALKFVRDVLDNGYARET